MLEESLTSLAILKVNWDQHGKDYVDNFVPFVTEAVRRCPQDHVSVTELQDRIREDFGLVIPQGALNTLLRRAARQGYVRREAGVFVRNLEPIPTGFAAEREGVARQQRALVEKLVSFCRERHRVEWSTEQAEEALLAHLQRACVPILAAAVDGCPVPLPNDRLPNSEFLVSSFVVHLADIDPEGFGFLETVMKGHMLASALFLPDIAKANQRFDDLEVFIDTRLILRAVGLEGQGLQAPTTELLNLLYGVNVSLACFDITLSEVRGILDAVHFALQDPRHRHRPGLFSVYEHMLSIGARASDVELTIANLERSLKRLHIHIKPTPSHEIRYGLNEKRLQELVSEELPTQKEEAQRHDIDCLTSIHRLRKGQAYSEIERSKYVFVTSNYLLARASARFFVEAYERVAAPLCINDHTLTTLAWVKNPKYAADFSRHRLIADSYAALHPGNELWRRYLEEVSRLRESGDITDEDYHILRFSTVARNALLDATLGSPDAFTEGTVPQILERARSNIRGEMERQLRDEAEERVAAKEMRHAKRLTSFAARVGAIVGKAAYVALALIFIVGFYATLPSSMPSVGDATRRTIQAAIVIFAMIAIWSALEGGTVRALARRLETWIGRWIGKLLVRVVLGDPENV